MNNFAKFEKFVPHSIIMQSFMIVGSQMPELDCGRQTESFKTTSAHASTGLLFPFLIVQMKLFNHGGNCQLQVREFALYFAMEQTNLGDLCLRPKQTEILLNAWLGKDITGL